MRCAAIQRAAILRDGARHGGGGRREWELARGWANLACAVVEQVALEGGSQWTTGWLLSTIPEPPWPLVQRPIASNMTLHSQSRLLNPRWIAAVTGFLSDT